MGGALSSDSAMLESVIDYFSRLSHQDDRLGNRCTPFIDASKARAATGKEVGPEENQKDRGAGIAMSNDSQHVALGVGAGSALAETLFVEIDKWKDKEEPRELPLREHGIGQISFSPDRH